VVRGKADLRLSAALHSSSLRHVGLLGWLPRSQDFRAEWLAPGGLVGYRGIPMWWDFVAKVVSWAGGSWSWAARFCILQFQGPQRLIKQSSGSRVGGNQISLVLQSLQARNHNHEAQLTLTEAPNKYFCVIGKFPKCRKIGS